MKLRDLVTDPCAMLDVAHFQGASIPWEECAALGFGNAAWIGKDPDLASLHGDPRFEALLGRMALAG